MRLSSSVVVPLAAVAAVFAEAAAAAHAAVPLLAWSKGASLSDASHRILGTAESSDMVFFAEAVPSCDANVVIFEQQGHSTRSLLADNYLDSIKGQFQASSQSLEVSYLTGGNAADAIAKFVQARCSSMSLLEITLNDLATFSLNDAAVVIVRMDAENVLANAVAVANFVAKTEATRPETVFVFTASKEIEDASDDYSRMLSAAESRHVNIRSFELDADNTTISIVFGTGWYDEFRFFTPAIFDGVIALFFVFAIMFGGLSSIASLQTNSKFEKPPK